MSERALQARIYKITDPQKMYSFAQALEWVNFHTLAGLAYDELAKMGYDGSGKALGGKGGAYKELPKKPGGVPGDVTGVTFAGKKGKEKMAHFTVFEGTGKPGELMMYHVDKPEKKVAKPKPQHPLAVGPVEMPWEKKKVTTFERKEAKEELKFHEMMEKRRAAKKETKLPAKGEKIVREPRHIILSDDPEHEAYRQALLAKEAKAVKVEKDKAGNIIAEKKPDPIRPEYAKKIKKMTVKEIIDRTVKYAEGERETAKKYVEKRSKRELKAYLDKEKDPWKDMPSGAYGRKALMLETPFKKSKK